MTLLAFGNGAPDVFSALSAVQNMKNDDVGLVLGALLGIKSFTLLLLNSCTAFRILVHSILIQCCDTCWLYKDHSAHIYTTRTAS